MPVPCSAEISTHDRVAAPLLGDEAELGELLEHAVGVGVGAVHLVDRDDDRDVGGLRVVDRLDGLGHDAVVGGDDQHDDVGDRRRPARAST